MRRLAAFLLVAGIVAAPAQLRERDSASEESEESTAGLVDEDEDYFVEKEYAFNPIQAKKELKVGNFYAKKGNHRAAAARYLEATRWNPSYAEAFWRLARSREKLEQANLALEAYEKFLSLEPDDKRAKRARKRAAALEKEVQTPVSPDETP